MNIIQIWGGLGNQMFQYAFAKGLAYKTGKPFSVDLSFFDNQDPSYRCCVRTYELEQSFGLKLAVVEKDVLHRLRKKSPFNWVIGRNLKIHAINPLRRDRDEAFHPEMWSPIWPKDIDIYYKGYWQHEEYFNFIAEEIRSDFNFKPLASEYAKEVLQQIQATESISLHVRRTDFVGSENEVGLEYYQQAINRIERKISSRKDVKKQRIKNDNLCEVLCDSCLKNGVISSAEIKAFVFSDDIEWVKNNFKLDLPVTYVDQTTDQAEDMFLMSQCKHNILAPKSSFSWWAAWLNSNSQKIVI